MTTVPSTPGGQARNGPDAGAPEEPAAQRCGEGKENPIHIDAIRNTLYERNRESAALSDWKKKMARTRIG